MVQVHYDEGVANRIGPESCLWRVLARQTPGRLGARAIAPIRVAFRQRNTVDTRVNPDLHMADELKNTGNTAELASVAELSPKIIRFDQCWSC